MGYGLKVAIRAHNTAVTVTVRGSGLEVAAGDVAKSGEYSASPVTQGGIGSVGEAQLGVIEPGSVERSRAGC